MQKNILLISWLSALTLVLLYNTYSLYNSNQKIAYIDNQKLLSNYQGMLDAQKEFQSKAAIWQANVDTLMKEVQRAIADYEKSSVGMSKKEQNLSKELILTKQQQLRDYQAAMQEKSKVEDQKITQRVLTVVNTYLTEYGKKNNYLILFGATSSGNIVYAEETVDVTDEVLSELNALYQK